MPSLRFRSAALAAGVSLVLAPAAAAKGPATLEICGATECRTFRADPSRGGRNAVLVFSVLNEALDSTRFRPAPPPSPYFTLQVDAEGLDAPEPRTYVPASELMSQGSSWIAAQPDIAAALKRATTDLEPAPPPPIRSATVAGLRVDDPALYARLLGAFPAADPPADRSSAVEIALRGDRVTPWTDPDRPLRYLAATDLLQRGPDWVRVPPALAADVERDLASVGTDARGASAGAVAIAVLLGLALLLVAWRTIGRRRSTSAPRRSRARAS